MQCILHFLYQLTSMSFETNFQVSLLERYQGCRVAVETVDSCMISGFCYKVDENRAVLGLLHSEGW
jgi:hypothetical protein